MKKFEKTTSVREIIRVYCDVCGKETKHKRNCECCGKDLCHYCIGHEESEGDYSNHYCLTCWEIGEVYQHKINELYEEIDKINNEWKLKCKI